jgi:hypothetical protein
VQQQLSKYYETPTYCLDLAGLRQQLEIAMFIAQELTWWQTEIEPTLDEEP